MYDYYSFIASGLGFIIIAVFIYFFLVILKRAQTAKHQGVNIAPFIAQALIFFFFALIRLFLNLNEFDFLTFGSENLIFYTLAVIFGYSFFISFILVAETILKRTYYLQTIICIITSISGVIIFNTLDQLRFFTKITTPIFALILLLIISSFWCSRPRVTCAAKWNSPYWPSL